MRYILFILLMFPIVLSAQEDITTLSVEDVREDSITVPTSYIVNAANEIRQLRDSISELTRLVDEYKISDATKSVLLRQNDLEIEMLTKRSELSDGIITRYSDNLYITQDREWYDHPLVYFLSGLGTAYFSSIIYRNIK